MAVEEMTPGVARLRTLIANIYLVGSPGGPWALVDTGTPGNAGRIRDAAELRFGRGARPEAILLTHGHWDHAGSALELAGYWDVPIYAHRLERPFLTGTAAYPAKDPMAGGAFSFLCRFLPSSTADLGERLCDLPEGGEVPGLAGWRWHFTPGHAPGHVAFFQRDESVLLAGDACVTMDLDSAMGMIAQEPVICRPPAAFTYDWDQAQRSVELLADLRPTVIGTGHGEPMSGRAVAVGLADLARDFPRPRRGRYVNEPARTDETGVTFLPPPVPDPAPKIAAAVGLAAMALGAVVMLSRRERE
ncbi:MAG: MBL fold metallo-hydrolase [Bryobacteraceae bacterium]|jgi:glyoxylase-like metal-dependent hydrolase (beta-lactamase superfamily II)